MGNNKKSSTNKSKKSTPKNTSKKTSTKEIEKKTNKTNNSKSKQSANKTVINNAQKTSSSKTSTQNKNSKKVTSKSNTNKSKKKKELALLVIENKKQFKFNKKILIYAFLFLFSISLVFSGIRLVGYKVDTDKTESVIEDIAQDIVVQEVIKDETPVEQYVINFESLKEKNPDTVAFIKVNGTEIEYVVTKANNNKFYLNHDFNKDYNAGGWVFADYTNKFDGTDKNIVIYGHNMHNGTMFGSLKNIFTPEWQEEDKNRYIKFITEEGESVYEVFSIYEILNEDYYIRTDLSDREFPDFINRMQRRSFYDFGVDLENTESILTLSTCSGNNKYRVVLQAKKLTDEIDLLFVTD